MRVSKDFMIRQIMDDYLLVPMGETALRLSAILTTNEVGAFLWSCLEEESTPEMLVEQLTYEFEVDSETAREDVEAFLQELKRHDLLL